MTLSVGPAHLFQITCDNYDIGTIAVKLIEFYACRRFYLFPIIIAEKRKIAGS